MKIDLFAALVTTKSPHRPTSRNARALARRTLLVSMAIFVSSTVTFLSVPALAAKKPKAKAAKTVSAAAAKKKSQEQNLKIQKINITGNRKIEKDAIEARLKSKVDGGYSSDMVKEDIQSLFRTGYFYDIQVYRDVSGNKVTLTYNVVEKPSISEIVFEGNSEIKSEELLEGSGLKAYEILDMSKVRDAIEKMQKLYEDKGYFLAKIDLKTEEVKKDETVKLTFTVSENDKVKVKKITFLGNRKLKDGFLKAKMATTEGSFFSFMSGSGAYKQDAFDRDMQLLRYVYFNEGYVQVKIDRPQVYVTADKKSIYITVRIDEGEQFDVGEIDYAGDILFPREELSEGIEINKREVFSYEVLQKDLSTLQAKYGDLGYAFANVIPRTRINEKDRKVDITFEFDKGNKVYFGQINMVGNSKTRDKVVRRELRIREGELYNETRKRKSLENIQRLGYFEDVNFKTSTPPDKPDQLNIDIVVKERNTGSIQLGAGYGSVTGFTLQGQVNQTNFLGKGQTLGVGLNVSSIGSFFNFNFTEPYFLDTDWSLGFDLYRSIQNRYDYDETKTGMAFRLGHPLNEENTLMGTIRLKNEWTHLKELYNADGTLLTDYTVFPLQTADGSTRSLTGIVEYDKRNDRFSPTGGVYASTSLEYAGILGGTLDYTKGSTTVRYFKKLFWDVVWRNNLQYSFITSHSADQDPPFNELFLLGGPYSLRGYQFFRVGKRKFSQQYYSSTDAQTQYPNPDDRYQQALRPVGGRQQALYQMEFEFPLIAEAGIKGVTFYDVGEAEDQLTSGNVYSDVGFGFRWFSPIGPLRFEWGFPMKTTTASPDAVEFQFSIGSPF